MEGKERERWREGKRERALRWRQMRDNREGERNEDRKRGRESEGKGRKERDREREREGGKGKERERERQQRADTRIKGQEGKAPSRAGAKSFHRGSAGLPSPPGGPAGKGL